MAYKDRTKAKLYARQHYEKNKQVYIERAKKFTKLQRIKLRNLIWEYLLQHPCLDCQETDPVVLQFDHQRDKKFHICDGIRRGLSNKTMLEEIAKCEIRCANCHAKKTAKEYGWWKNKLVE